MEIPTRGPNIDPRIFKKACGGYNHFKKRMSFWRKKGWKSPIKAVAGDVTGKSFYARLGKVALDGWLGGGWEAKAWLRASSRCKASDEPVQFRRNEARRKLRLDIMPRHG